MAMRRSDGRRRSAQERRDLVVETARQEFATYGYAGSTGESLSYRAGISHPYLLRLFGSKKELFLAVVEQVFDGIVAVVRDASARTGGALADRLAEAIASYLEELNAGGFLLQVCAASGDEEIRLSVRRRLAELHGQLTAAGVDEAEVGQMLGRLLVWDAASVMRLDDLAGRERWARQLVARTPAE
jgi:AcrR family transcriptional regulator